MDKAFVSPFLFDIKRSEVDGPILQFQSTIFEKDDLKKLIKTLNKACDKDGLASDRLEKAFGVWYPTLESELSKLQDTPPEAHEVDGTELHTPKAQEILEEILELSRINQKLIRNPDGSLGANLEEITHLLGQLLERSDRSGDPFIGRQARRFHPRMLEEVLHFSPMGENSFVGIQMALAMIRNEFPWIYDAGIETISILRSRRSNEEQQNAIMEFNRLLEFSFDHPLMREMYGSSKEYRLFYRELPHLLSRALEQTIEGKHLL